MIKLTGHGRIFTNKADTDYYIESGTVNIYFCAFQNGKAAANRLIASCEAGSTVPYCHITDRYGNETDTETVITLKLGADETAVIREVRHSSDAVCGFLKLLGISCSPENGDDPESVMREKLPAMMLAVWDGRCRQTEKRAGEGRDSRNLHRGNLARLFMPGRDRWREHIPDSPSLLYNAMTVVCRQSHIPEADYDALVENCGVDFTPEDYARCAGFICRKINLPDKWQSGDIGPVLLIAGEEERPVACYRSRGRNRYWDPAENRDGTLKSFKTGSGTVTAYSFVRPLPSGKLKWKDIILHTLREFRVLDLVTLVLTTVLAATASLMTSTLSNAVYGMAIPSGNTSVLGMLSVMVLTWITASVVFNVGKSLTTFRMSSRSRYAIQGALYDRLFHMKTSYFRGKESAQIAYRTDNLAGSYCGIYSAVIDIAMMIVSSAMYVTRMSSYSAQLTSMTVFFVIPAVIITIVIGYFVQKAQMKCSRLTAEMRSYLYQVFSGIQTVRCTGSADSFQNSYLSKYTGYGRLYMKRTSQQRLSDAVVSGLTCAAVVGAYYMMAGNSLGISTSTFLAFLSASSVFTGAMTAIASDVLRIFIMYPMLKDGADILNAPAEAPDQGEILSDFSGNVEIRNLYFRYNNTDADSPWIINNLSLDIKAGEYVGIVGTSGCGKSTLIRLILGFETPSRGTMLFDHNPIDKLNRVSLRRHIGTVLQDGVLFAGSIYKNISIAKPGATVEEVYRAADTACILEDIMNMPLGFATLVSEECDTISGGQKQRIMIARAVLGNPSLLLMDEATSSLDNVTQAEVTEKLDGLNSTRIVIAHRPSTVKHCDRILVMNNGRIEEQGTYDELVAAGGLFSRLVNDR